MKTWIRRFLEEQSRVALQLPVEDIACWTRIIVRAYKNRAAIFVCGNGGSASAASHFANDLGKAAPGLAPYQTRLRFSSKQPCRFRPMSLVDNVAWLTALANDTSYDDVFVEQLKNFAAAGDVLIGVSVSGNSPNIIKAVQWANRQGLITLGLTNASRCNRLAHLAQHAIKIPSRHYGHVENAQMLVLHTISYSIMEGQIIL